MKTIYQSTVGILLTSASLALIGCDEEGALPPPATKTAAKPAVKPKEIGKNVFLEVHPDGIRRVLVKAYVCRRKGQLEQLLCRKQTKEHEAILAADVDARHIHVALLAAGADAGSPVKFVPKYQPAHGDKIKVLVQYNNKKTGKTETWTAQRWVRDMKTKKDMKYDWIFAGSQLFQDPNNPNAPPFYAANDGDVICVSNFDTAMLDLPIKAPNENSYLLFEANTERIPPIDTPVTVILEPVGKAKDQKKKQ